MKTNSFGLYLLNLRNRYNENMNEMAMKLDISKSYLYYLSSGERTVSSKIIEKIIKSYNLNNDEVKELNKSIAYSRDVVKLDLSGLDLETRKIIIELIHRIPTMSEEKILQLKKIIM